MTDPNTFKQLELFHPTCWTRCYFPDGEPSICFVPYQQGIATLHSDMITFRKVISWAVDNGYLDKERRLS